jgi:phosphatidylinositol glycan class Z
MIKVTDLSGASPSVLSKLLSSLSSPTVLLITPAYAFDSLNLDRVFPSSPPRQLFGRRTFGLHVDMDRLDEVLGARWGRMGLGVWLVGAA